jgi:hypothetical protein
VRGIIHSPPPRFEVKNVWSITSALHFSLDHFGVIVTLLTFIWGSWLGALRYKPEVASSIPDGVIGIFH